MTQREGTGIKLSKRQKRSDDCPKSSRCYYGKECPREYEPDAIYSCFERHKPNNSMSQYSKSDLIAIINFARRQSQKAKEAIDEACGFLAQHRRNEAKTETLSGLQKGEKQCKEQTECAERETRQTGKNLKK